MAKTNSLESLMKQFARDVEAVVRAEVEAKILAALGEGGRKNAPRPAGGKLRRARASGQKRTPLELEQDLQRLLAAVTRRPGMRIEQLGKVMKMTTKDLRLPALKLIAAKSIHTKGLKRSMRYYAKGQS